MNHFRKHKFKINEEGIDILIEEIGLDDFVDFVYRM